jgi:hypothetical protein
MVIDNLHVVRVAALPAETNTILVVNTDALLPRTVTPQLLQAVSGRDTEVIQRLRSVDEQQLPQRRTLERLGELTAALAPEEAFGLTVAEAPDHARHNNATRHERQALR